MKKLLTILILLFLTGFGCKEVKNMGTDLSPSTEMKADIKDVVFSEEIRDGVMRYVYDSKVNVSDEVLKETNDWAKEQGHTIKNEVVSKRTPNIKVYETEEFIDGKPVLLGEVIAGSPQYLDNGNGVWTQMEEATTTEEVFLSALKPTFFENIAKLIGVSKVMAINSTTYPDAKGIDGHLIRTTAGTWDAIRNGAGTAVNIVATYVGFAQHTDNGTTYSNITRGILQFDTEPFDDGIVISSSTVVVTAKEEGHAVADQEIVIISATTTQIYTLLPSDYEKNAQKSPASPLMSDTVYITEDFTANNVLPFTLNSAGIASIDLTTTTKFASMYDADRTDTEPAKAGTYVYAYVNSSRQTGTAKDPKLLITYTEAPEGGPPPPKANIITFQ